MCGAIGQHPAGGHGARAPRGRFEGGRKIGAEVRDAVFGGGTRSGLENYGVDSGRAALPTIRVRAGGGQDVATTQSNILCLQIVRPAMLRRRPEAQHHLNCIIRPRSRATCKKNILRT